MKVIVDVVWMLWGLGAWVYDYFNTSAMEERIHTLENVLTIHQCLMVFLTAILAVLIYVVFKKH